VIYSYLNVKHLEIDAIVFISLGIIFDLVSKTLLPVLAML